MTRVISLYDNKDNNAIQKLAKIVGAKITVPNLSGIATNKMISSLRESFGEGGYLFDNIYDAIKRELALPSRSSVKYDYEDALTDFVRLCISSYFTSTRLKAELDKKLNDLDKAFAKHRLDILDAVWIYGDSLVSTNLENDIERVGASASTCAPLLKHCKAYIPKFKAYLEVKFAEADNAKVKLEVNVSGIRNSVTPDDVRAWAAQNGYKLVIAPQVK